MMTNRTTTGIFNPTGKSLSFMTVMVCPDSKCAHVWEASNRGNPCPLCGNPDVVPACNWNLDEEVILKLGKLPAHLPKMEVPNEK